MRTVLAVIISLLAMCAYSADRPYKEMHYRLKISDRTLNPDLRLAYVDSLLDICPEAEDSLRLLSAHIAYDSGRYRETLFDIGKLLDGNNDNKKRKLPLDRKCDALFMLTKTHLKCGEYAEAMVSAHELCDIPKPDSLLYHDVNALTIICDYLSRFKTSDSIPALSSLSSNINKAEEILRHSVRNNVSSDVVDRMKKAILFSKINMAMDNKDFAKALALGVEMQKYPLDDVEKVALEGNTASIYYYLGEYDLASQHYRNVLSSPGWHMNHAVSLENYMIVLIAQGKPEEALKVLDSHPEIENMVKGMSQEADILQLKGMAKKMLGDLNGAYADLYSSIEIRDSLQKSVNVSNAEKLMRYIGYDEIIRDEKEKSDSRNIIIIGLSIALALSLIVLLYVILRKRRANESAESDEVEKDEADGNETIDSGSLAAHALHIASLNETIAGISEILGSESISDKEKLSSIQANVKEVLSYDDLWDLFHIQFEMLHPDFFRNLKKECPDLTLGESRMCAYVMLNMTNKEIAAMTRRNIHSVETMRYRLTKKMNLPQGVSLSEKLHTLCNDA